MRGEAVDVIPAVFDYAALSNNVTIGQRQTIVAQDAAPISLALSTLALIRWNTSLSVVSTPALSNLGTDVQLGADQAIIIEHARLSILSGDASGKLQILSSTISDAFGDVFATSSQGNPLPYTFPAAAGARFDVVPVFTEPGDTLRIGAETSGSSKEFLVCDVAILNLDGAAAHTYQRFAVVTYRIISGIRPSTPRVIRVRE